MRKPHPNPRGSKPREKPMSKPTTANWPGCWAGGVTQTEVHGEYLGRPLPHFRLSGDWQPPLTKEEGAHRPSPSWAPPEHLRALGGGFFLGLSPWPGSSPLCLCLRRFSEPSVLKTRSPGQSVWRLVTLFGHPHPLFT